jgi:hypothetical protein
MFHMFVRFVIAMSISCLPLFSPLPWHQYFLKKSLWVCMSGWHAHMSVFIDFHSNKSWAKIATSIGFKSMNYCDSINWNLEPTFVENLTKNHPPIFQSQWYQPTSWYWSRIGYSSSPPQSSRNCWKQKNEDMKESFLYSQTQDHCVIHPSWEKMMEIQSCPVAPILLSGFLSWLL